MKKIIRTLKIIFGTVFSLLGFRSKKTIYYASAFGKIEHRFGRLTGILILASFLIEYYKWGKEYDIILYSIAASFLSWAIYLCSHLLEKKLYGKGLRHFQR
jgi:hypothetical protein